MLKDTVNLGIVNKVSTVIPLLVSSLNFIVNPVYNLTNITGLFTHEFALAHISLYGDRFSNDYFILLRDLYNEYQSLTQ